MTLWDRSYGFDSTEDGEPEHKARPLKGYVLDEKVD